MVGVGMTPPKVLGTPKPASSVMISSTFGALLGGITRGAHQGLDCSASCLITPPNFGSGGGNWRLLMVVVALGEPRVPVTCWLLGRRGRRRELQAARQEGAEHPAARGFGDVIHRNPPKTIVHAGRTAMS